MSNQEKHHQVNYVELPATNLAASKQFFTDVFNWTFTDYGPDYSAFNQGLDGGFFSSDKKVSAAQGSALVVLFSNDLDVTFDAVKAHGGEILQDIFEFPGGRRFHFADPSGNEFAVWAEL